MIKIDLEKKNMMINGSVVINNGIPINGFPIRTEPVTYEELERLYETYKFSVPTESETKMRRPYFKALPIEQIPVKLLCNGIDRTEAREALETTLLYGILNGSIRWENPEHWFWQSSQDRDFVILKKWVE